MSLSIPGSTAMSNVDPSKFQFSTLFRYLLNYNYDDPAQSVSVPSTSHPLGTTSNYSLSIPIERTRDFAHVRINFSHLPNNWYSFPQGDVALDANFAIATVGSYSSNLLTLTFYVINQSGGAASNTAFTATAKVLAFVQPT
jgi:hypothetical protein